MSKRWVYHKTNKPKIVNSEDAQSFYDDGWVDSPAKVSDKVEEKVEQTDKVKTIEEMDKPELEAYAKEKYGVDLDKRKGIKKLLAEVVALDVAE